MIEILKGTSSISSDFVIFLGNSEDILLNAYMLKNYNSIAFKLRKIGMQFIYYPALHKELVLETRNLADYLKWNIPVLNSLGDDELSKLLTSLRPEVFPENFDSGIVAKFFQQNVRKPCLLRSKEESANEFLCFDLTYQTEEQLDGLFDRAFHELQIEKVITFNYESLEYDVERSFSDDAKAISAELKTKIERIKGEKKYEVLAEAVLLLITILKDEKPDLFGKIKPLLTNQSIHEEAVILSQIVVNRNYRILLPAFGDMEVMMHPLSKAVYILFLRHLEGIRFKELYQYRSELISIYNQITSRDVKADILRSIDDLVDMRNPSINQKCSRIREAFRNLMDDRTAKNYYITGLNGEAKRISLPQELIVFEK